jgi:hypothetical protein
MSTFHHLLHLARAGATVLHIASYEWERVRGQAIGLAKELRLPLKVWSQSTGLQVSSEERDLNAEDEAAIDPLEVLRSIYAADDPGIWLMEDFQPFLRDEHHVLLRWLRELTRMPASPRKLVVLSTPLPGLPMDRAAAAQCRRPARRASGCCDHSWRAGVG